MCQVCWSEQGCYSIVNETTKKAAALIKQVSEFGHLHIIVSDWNLEDESLTFCLGEVVKNKKRLPFSDLKPEMDLLAILDGMSAEERSSAMAIANNLVQC